jgi:hypothetical protein
VIMTGLRHNQLYLLLLSTQHPFWWKNNSNDLFWS